MNRAKSGRRVTEGFPEIQDSVDREDAAACRRKSLSNLLRIFKNMRSLNKFYLIEIARTPTYKRWLYHCVSGTSIFSSQ